MINEIDFQLVKPYQDDALLVMAWRNDPQTLANSFHTTPKLEHEFLEEFYERYFCFPALPPLFACYEGKKIAFLKFVPCEDFAYQGKHLRSCLISINVAPKWRGKGFGSAILKAIQPWIKQQGIEVIYGEVKVDNIVSQKAFESAGFQAFPETIKIVDDFHAYLIIRYAMELTSRSDKDSHVFIIAEAGSNWHVETPSHHLEMAKTLIAIAAEAKADAVKFQVFRPETIYVKNAGSLNSLKETGVNKTMEELFSDLMMPYEMLIDLHQECLKANIEFMATPFSKQDFLAVDPLVKRHKIASYELNHPHLLVLAAQSKKPLILSTGASTEEEIAWAVETYKAHEGRDLTLLQCTACYPAPPGSMHLNTLPWLKQRFSTAVGLSDHSLNPYCAPISAVAMGATVIEKHFTYDRKLPGPDHAFALEPLELKQLVQSVRMAEQMKGSYVKCVDPSELELRSFARRGIQAIAKIAKGDLLQENINVAILRPGRQSLGIHPKFISEIEKKPARRQLEEGEGLVWGDW